MKQVIYQHLATADQQQLAFPVGAQLLSLQMVVGQPRVYALADTDAPLVPYMVYTCGTGHPAPDNATYLGTFQLYGGSLVFHVFVANPIAEHNHALL